MSEPASSHDVRLGTCPHCGAENSYLNAVCEKCGQRLPWGVAVARRPSDAAPIPEPVPFNQKLQQMPLWLPALISFLVPLLGVLLTLYFLLQAQYRRAIVCLCATIVALPVFFFVNTLLSTLLH